MKKNLLFLAALAMSAGGALAQNSIVPPAVTFSPYDEEGAVLESVTSPIDIAFDGAIPDGIEPYVMYVGGDGFGMSQFAEPIEASQNPVTIELQKEFWGNPYMGQYLLSVIVCYLDENGDFIYNEDDEPIMYGAAYFTKNVFTAEFVSEYPDNDWSHTTFDRAYREGVYTIQYNNEVEFTNPQAAARIRYVFNDGSAPISKVLSYNAENPEGIQIGWDDMDGNFAINIVYGDETYDAETIASVTIAISGIKSVESGEMIPNHSITLENNSGVSQRSQKSNGTNSISNLLIESGELVDIYNAQGTIVKANASISDLKTLSAGLYIVNGQKFLVR